MRLLMLIFIGGGIVGSFLALLALAPTSRASSNIQDAVDDAVAVKTHETDYLPFVQPYHDVVSSSVKRENGELLLTAELNGDPNLDRTYETVYIWLIEYPTLEGSKKYTIIVPHFPPEMGLTIGWHLAVFDNNEERYLMPLRQIDSMPANRVEVNLDSAVIGSPAFLWWQVFVMVRVDTDFSKPPDFLMDSAPDNSNALLWPFT